MRSAAAAATEVKSCCAAAYSSTAARFLLGESFHPGGQALTTRLARALRVGPGATVADIASGPGSSALLVARMTGSTVVGLDLAFGNAASAAARAAEASLTRFVRFVCADAEALPLGDSSVDGALCECGLCLFPDKSAAAGEIARVLRPGARLALSDITADRARFPANLRSLEAHVACLADARPLAEIAALLGDAGLVVEAIERHDDVLGETLERVGARLRMARLVGGGPLGSLLDTAEDLLAAAREALAEGSIGYGVIVARR